MNSPTFQKKSQFLSSAKSLEIYQLVNSNGYEIELMNFGARMNSIKIPLKNAPKKKIDVLLGYDNLADYIDDTDYMNAMVGRVSNRIRFGKFSIQGIEHQLCINENLHHLHGGSKGFDSRFWNFKKSINSEYEVGVVLQLFSKDMDQGYPGNLELNVSFILDNQNLLKIKMEAESDAPTPVSVTNHNYWNFNGHEEYHADISNHKLRIESCLICETDSDLLPTGRLLNISRSNLDYTEWRILDPVLRLDQGLDFNYCFGNVGILSKQAEIYSPSTGLGMSISSDLPGMQCYSGAQMKTSYRGKYARTYGRSYGLCLEPQFFPDAVNQSQFLSPIIFPGQKYLKTIVMTLKNDY